VVATTVVAVLPLVVVWGLLAEGVISSPWVCLGLAIALSLAASAAGSAYWKRRGGHGDVLFSELLLWGWLHRYRAERRLANSVDRLGLSDSGPGFAQTDETTERKAQILGRMASALDAQDPYTDGHSRRVAVHAAMIAHKMGLSREEVAKVRTAAAVHDIGKLRTPPEVLNKPGMLTAAEFEVVKRHVEDGAEIVSAMGDPEITATVLHHHERFDGHGYPDGLVGEQTPIAARIIAVADTFDALTSVRPYRAAIPHKKALAIIVDASGTQLDPVAVRAFLKCYSGRRWVLFWTLLAASPQSALAVGTGRSEGGTSLGSAATVATPAVLAAVVAAAVGTTGSVGGTTDALKVAQQPAQATASPNPSSAKRNDPHRRASKPASTSASSSSRPADQAAPAVASTAVVAGRSGGGGSGPGSGLGGVAAVRTVGRSGTGSSSANRSGGSRRAGSGVTRGSPGGRTTPSRPVSGRPRGGGSPGGTPGGTGPGGSGSPGGAGTGGAPAGSGNGSGNPTGGGGTGSGGGGSGAGGGNPGGGGGGPGGGGQGSGSSGGGGQGGGGGGPGGGGQGSGNQPQSKAACMNGGFSGFGFRNQGQCIAWVEHNVLH
jgi:putative nucleotidyltransferase with HDIG domain